MNEQRTSNTRGSKCSFKKECFWMGLFAFGLVVLSILLISFLFKGKCTGDKAETTAIAALKMQVEKPQTLKILHVSKPDSVFRNRLCPDHEVIEMSSRFLDYSMTLMDDPENMKSDFKNPAYMAAMERFSENSATMEKLNRMLESEPGEFCGWRVKVNYTANDRSNTTYKAEKWFIFDKNKTHILNSFDVPML